MTSSRRSQAYAATIALVGFAATAQAQAQPPTPAPCAIPAIDVAGDPQAAEQALATHIQRLHQCQYQAPWLAAMGTTLNRLGRYAQAAEYLERALLLEPQHTSVQMEYAIALAGGADQPSALALLHALRADASLTPQMRQAVEQQIARWTASSPQGGSRSYVQVRLGRDSNLLGAPNLGSLTLTLPGQTLQLPLDASYLQRSGNYRRLDAGWNIQQGAWQAAVNASGRDSPQEPTAALQQIQAAGEHTGPGHYASASAAYLQSQAGTRYRALGLAAGRQWDNARPGSTRSACRSRAGAQWQQRTLVNSPSLSGHYGGLAWQRTCEPGASAPQAGALQAWQWSASWGRDLPTQAGRPGGAQQQASLRLLALGAGAAPGQQWLLDAELYRQQDTRGYSPLLQNNARRHLTRLALRAEYALPLPDAPAWQLMVGAEWQQQQSNLPLFQQKSQGAYMALRRQW